MARVLKVLAVLRAVYALVYPRMEWATSAFVFSSEVDPL